ncbi:AAA family ATPase, partial [Limnohabitans sp. Rim8]|uniref:AAA family ATPase n=1 Tax=Limnohabitans sp. Rim8 TaxID=1100718 RepID=UPI0025F244C3
MKRYLDDRVQADLAKKMVFLTGPRQVGKTTLSHHLIAQQGGQYLNYDVPADRAIILHQRWNPLAPLLVLDEIHKMPDWKAWLKGVV